MSPSTGSPSPSASSTDNSPAWLAEFVLLAAIWGGSFVLMRLGATEFGPMATAFLRTLVAACVLLPLLLLRGQWQALRQHYRPIAVVGLLNSGIPFACYAYALLSISSGLSSILNATTPLWGALIAWWWLHDKPNASRILGLCLGFVGVALLASGKASFKPQADGSNSGLAVLACLLATLCYGIAGSFTKRYLTGVPPLVTATGSQVGACLGLGLPALWLWPAHTPRPQAWAAVVAVGLLCTALAYILYFRLIARAGPAKALAVTFLIPVFALAIGSVLLGEPISLWMLLCGLVIVGGTALATGLLRLPIFST